ncbi:Protein of unknown function [Pseudobacteriovorax antillogorgiicola]|uniref:DUF420 domain-containing protein n=1 Tax=Pseudobacteriovorax antillogorgiicola TaxID=1513793 RepID=A0A1Y6CA27_9BACT|nr:uncharacterized protein DUF420 [Pseudobacteriovorax antillogorgiicola]SMF50045.1 Protein of unknown function [Pseudobacteriovorax antillogorgiicola]
MIDQMSRAPIVVDIMAVVLVLVLPAIVLSIVLAKRRQYLLHKRIQQVIAVVMGILIIGFEYEMRTMGWRQIAEDSPYYDSYVMPALIVHLLFAIPTFVLWILVVYGAAKNFGTPPKPSKYSMIHKRMGRAASYLSFGTGITAWLFYWLAFVVG